jgi:hypothetical protein
MGQREPRIFKPEKYSAPDCGTGNGGRNYGPARPIRHGVARFFPESAEGQEAERVPQRLEKEMRRERISAERNI